jgi:hypothetical protein
MTETNPAGTMFLSLIEELMDLVGNPDVSRIEVVMASYDLDEHRGKKLVGGKHSIAKRAFVIRGMNKDVQENLRIEFDSGPITHLIILWTERFQNEKKVERRVDYDAVEKSVISDYLRQ